MLRRKFDPDFEWRWKAGPARRAERDPRPVGAGSDTAEGKAAIGPASQGLHHLPRVVHQLHRRPAHELEGFAPEGPHRSSDLAPGRGCGRLSFYEPCAVRRVEKGLGAVPQDQIDARDSLGCSLDPHLERGVETALSQRAGCEAHPVVPG
jgi:hypothetical protein